MKMHKYVLAAMMFSAPVALYAGGDYSDKEKGHSGEHMDKMSQDSSYQSYDKETSERAGNSFDRLDANNNGELEESEVLAGSEGIDYTGVEFRELDTDEDSEVSREEWNRYFSQN